MYKFHATPKVKGPWTNAIAALTMEVDLRVFCWSMLNVGSEGDEPQKASKPRPGECSPFVCFL